MRGLLSWGSTGSGARRVSSCSSRVLVCRLRPFGIWVQLLRSIWNILRDRTHVPDIGRWILFTSGPPGKSPGRHVLTPSDCDNLLDYFFFFFFYDDLNGFDEFWSGLV